MDNVSPFVRCSKTPRSPERTSSPRIGKSVTDTIEVRDCLIHPGGNEHVITTNSPVEQRETMGASLSLPVIFSSANGDALSMLGAKIEELAKMMVLQRHVNQQMRGVVSSISELHKQVKEERKKLATNIDAKSRVEKATQTSTVENAKANGERSRAQYNGNPNTENSPQPIGKRTKSISFNAQLSRLEVACKQGTNDKQPRGNNSITNKNEGWVEVHRARRHTTPSQTSAVEENRIKSGTFSEIVRKGGETQRIKARPDAFIISNKGDGSYADILRAIKSEPSLSKLGDMVTRIRKTQKGEMLFQLKTRGEGGNAQYQGMVEKVLGNKAEVRVLKQELIIECRDLDEVSTREDVIQAIVDQFNIPNINVAAVKSLRKAYGSTQIATLSLPVSAANLLLAKGKLKVGWVVCRLRRIIQPTRCFRCLDFGHISKNCTECDRSKLCRRCGEEGHIAKDCTNAPKCLLCQVARKEPTDHISGSSRCPAYRRALAKEII